MIFNILSIELLIPLPVHNIRIFIDFKLPSRLQFKLRLIFL